MEKKELKNNIERLKRIFKNLFLLESEVDLNASVLALFSYAYCYDWAEISLFIEAAEVMGYQRNEILINQIELEKEKLKNEQEENCAIC